MYKRQSAPGLGGETSYAGSSGNAARGSAFARLGGRGLAAFATMAIVTGAGYACYFVLLDLLVGK